MFEKIIIPKNGSDIKKMASRKIGLLKVKMQNMDQANTDASKSSFISQAQKDEIISINNKVIEEYAKSHELLQVIIDQILDTETYQLTLRELDFLTNQYVYKYE
jgi:hypothetical protein